MRILANENLPADAVEALRQQGHDAVEALRQHGHDVVWIRTEAPGSSDQQVLEWAQADDRILLTFDKDFGELAFRGRLAASSGIILLRISMPSPAYIARVVVAVLESRGDWAGHFSVVEDARIRMTPLPLVQ